LTDERSNIGNSKRHDGAAVDELLGGYSSYLVADANAV
jgi:hypothetical protein